MKIFNRPGLKIRISLIISIMVIFTSIISFCFLNKRRYKILMIGLDGASWNVITPLVEEGKLPNIKRLMDSGYSGKLRTFDPAISEVVWTTIATGKSPFSHGITDQLIKDPDTNELVLLTSNLRKTKAIWNILSEHNKRVGVVGYKVSWPAEKVKGVIISNRAAESDYRSSHYYSEPPLSTLFIEEIFNSFKIGKDFPYMLMDANWAFNCDNFMSNASKYLLKHKKFDFFCLYLFGIDSYSHYYWKYKFADGDSLSVAEISKYKDVIRDYYVWCDTVIGDLLKIVDKNTIVIVISDHGFKTTTAKRKNYLFIEMNNLLKVTGLDKFSYNSKEIKLENTPVVWWKNIKNMKVTGSLTMEEFNTVRENVKAILENIRVKETGQSIFKIIDETNSGFLLEPDIKYINQNPSCHILINGREYKILDFLKKNPISGDHDSREAIIIISGKHIRQNQRVTNATIFDIAPTILYLLDLPIATDMVGKVLVKATDVDILNKKPPRYIDTYEANRKPMPQKAIRNPADEKIIKERMRSLGYIN